ncbi:PEP-CTERM sorting domain-containing protein [Sphaerothrix gracilis]|uniref:PEP-CTERM sorting domain-containing protein n=1 Tax=Sphaerothrix gracilis TaxID=3151835 RepID=UPI0031FC8F4A
MQFAFAASLPLAVLGIGSATAQAAEISFGFELIPTIDGGRGQGILTFDDQIFLEGDLERIPLTDLSEASFSFSFAQEGLYETFLLTENDLTNVPQFSFSQQRLDAIFFEAEQTLPVDITRVEEDISDGFTSIVTSTIFGNETLLLSVDGTTWSATSFEATTQAFDSVIFDSDGNIVSEFSTSSSNQFSLPVGIGEVQISEPTAVPEPTMLLGSTVALALGSLLKRSRD